jgi:hypothetical protein
MRSICYDKRKKRFPSYLLFVPVGLCLLIIWFIFQINSPKKSLEEFAYTGIDGLKRYEPEPNKMQMIILFSTRCTFCMSYLSQLNKHSDRLPDFQYGLFTTDRNLFQSVYYKNWDSLQNDSRISIGMLDVNISSYLFSDPPLPSTFLYNEDHELIKSLRGEVQIREIMDWIPDANHKKQKKGV